MTVETSSPKWLLYTGLTVMIFGSNRKIGGVPLFGRKRSCLKRIKVMTQVRMEMEVGTLLLSSDKNSVIAKNVILHT